MTETAADTRWYAIQTYSGHENKVQRLVERRIDDEPGEGDAQEIREVLVPTQEVTEIRNGKRVNAMKKHTKAGGFIFERCLPLCVVSPSSVMIHRSVFDEVGLFNEDLPACEDYDLWLRICARFPVLYVDRPLIIKHGGHADQLSHRYPAMDRFRIIALENILQQNLSPQYYRAALNMLITKIDIYLQGAIKRDEQEEITKYQQKQRYYLSLREDSCHVTAAEVI